MAKEVLHGDIKIKGLSQKAFINIMNHYEEMVKKVQPYMNNQELLAIEEAFMIAFRAHGASKRKSGDPYILHPLSVAQIIGGELKLDATSIICALLHDVKRYTELSTKVIKEKFGEEVANVIEELDKIDFSFVEERETLAHNYRVFIENIQKDIRIILIKLAERLDNMRSIHFLPRIKQLQIAAETNHVYAAIAHRLGLNRLKTELEELSLKIFNPKVYYSIVSKLKNKREDRERHIIKFIQPLEEALKAAGFDFEIKTRAKSVFSIHKKIVERKIPFNEIYDLIAVRVILECSQEEELITCWEVYGLITRLFKPNESRTRDWITYPRSNGYESLHVTVMSHTGEWVEVQIRTRRMDEVANKGIAAHWLYKEKGSNLDPGLNKWLQEISNIIENAPLNHSEMITNLKKALYSQEISVFNEKEETVLLPRQATLLDFAIEYFGELGFKSTSGCVNGKICPLNHVLKNGDKVSLFFHKKQRLHEQWKTFVVTTKAHRLISNQLEKEYLIKQEKGQGLLHALFYEAQIPYTKEHIHLFRMFIGVNEAKTYFARIAEHFDLKKDFEHFKAWLKKGVLNSKEAQIEGNTIFRLHKYNREAYTIALCCMPVPGEEIIGFKEKEHFDIHKMACSKAIKKSVLHKEHLHEVLWFDIPPIAIDFNIKASNKTPFLKDLLKVLEGYHVFSFFSQKEYKETTFFIELEIEHINNLNEFTQKVQKIKGFIHLSRGIETDYPLSFSPLS